MPALSALVPAWSRDTIAAPFTLIVLDPTSYNLAVSRGLKAGASAAAFLCPILDTFIEAWRVPCDLQCRFWRA